MGQAFFGRDDHPTADSVPEIWKDHVPGIPSTTVYRVLVG
jgi:Fe2+ or Zn2+ uptake regulation protein